VCQKEGRANQIGGEVPDQDLPGPRWVRVKNVPAGICGADLSLFYVQVSPFIWIAALPGPPKSFMGHERVGHVIKVVFEMD
jgi:threonine dehydrogenase-like Zn-dependent dehydrogenase